MILENKFEGRLTNLQRPTPAQASEASIKSKYASGAPAGESVIFVTVLFITLPKINPQFRET